jgi:hypothetical protein
MIASFCRVRTAAHPACPGTAAGQLTCSVLGVWDRLDLLEAELCWQAHHDGLDTTLEMFRLMQQAFCSVYNDPTWQPEIDLHNWRVGYTEDVIYTVYALIDAPATCAAFGEFLPEDFCRYVLALFVCAPLVLVYLACSTVFTSSAVALPCNVQQCAILHSTALYDAVFYVCTYVLILLVVCGMSFPLLCCSLPGCALRWSV